MTNRERLLGVIKGENVDAKPTIAWPASESDSIVWAEVANPFGKALARGENLSEVLRKDLGAGEKALLSTAEEVKSDITAAISAGAQGIIYKLYGADLASNTPMEYGGHFLEVDRAILSQFDSIVRMIFVVGGADTFIDFVSDLPAEIFAWDVRGTGVNVQAVREMRAGTLAAASEDADILLSYPSDISSKIAIPQLANV